MAEFPNSWFNPAKKRASAWDSETDLTSFNRLWHTFMAARVTIAGVLVVLQAFLYALGNVGNGWSIAVCIAYLCATLAVQLLSQPQLPGNTFDAQWVSTIGVDVIAFSALNFLQSSGINYTPLFALPVLLASVLGHLLLALGTVASVTLLLLANVWWLSHDSMGEMGARFLQAGLSSSGFFAVAVLANQLALRLARQEKLTKNTQSIVRMQAQVNQLVIEALPDGVLVIDGNGIVRSANPASRRLLASGDTTRMAPFVLTKEASWQPLAEIVRITLMLKVPQAVDVNLEFPGRNTRRLHVRTLLAQSQDSSHESLCVMFLEDLREIEARVRVEKMAAMGRMSAAVAHEIRNPLAAISQANALLEEDLQDPVHRQLTTMISQNAQRLAKIVADILNISHAEERGPPLLEASLRLDTAMMRIASDWAKQTASTYITQITLNAEQAFVTFDFEHLRRLMINLLDNALRYASQTPGAIQVTTHLSSQKQVRLSVWSNGRPIEKTVQAHLFEPFFSSESRSSGLGLYICRELCEQYGALIGYQRSQFSAMDGNEFFVVFKSAIGHLSNGDANKPDFFDDHLLA